MALIVEGKIESAIENFSAYLKRHPDDLESLYGLAVAYTQKQDHSRATEYARQALDAGLPPGRLFAGPRDLLQTLLKSSEFQELIKDREPTIIHGPLLGCVTDRSAKFWVRTAREASVRVHLTPSKNQGHPKESAPVKTSSAQDFTGVASVNDLAPDTQYSYRISVNGNFLPDRWLFRTYPPSGSPATFQVGFGGGAGYTPSHERMWSTIASHELLAFLFLGDNV